MVLVRHLIEGWKKGFFGQPADALVDLSARVRAYRPCRGREADYWLRHGCSSSAKASTSSYSLRLCRTPAKALVRWKVRHNLRHHWAGGTRPGGEGKKVEANWRHDDWLGSSTNPAEARDTPKWVEPRARTRGLTGSAQTNRRTPQERRRGDNGRLTLWDCVRVNVVSEFVCVGREREKPGRETRNGFSWCRARCKGQGRG